MQVRFLPVAPSSRSFDTNSFLYYKKAVNALWNESEEKSKTGGRSMIFFGLIGSVGGLQAFSIVLFCIIAAFYLLCVRITFRASETAEDYGSLVGLIACWFGGLGGSFFAALISVYGFWFFGGSFPDPLITDKAITFYLWSWWYRLGLVSALLVPLIIGLIRQLDEDRVSIRRIRSGGGGITPRPSFIRPA
jgi:hypothetical protein